MPRVPNPVSSPYSALAESISRLGQAFFSGPSPIEQERYAGQAEYQRALQEKATLEAAKLRGQMGGNSQLAALFGGAGPVDINQASRLAIEAGYRPKDLADLYLFYAANGGADDAATARAMVGAGKPLGENEAVSLGHQVRIRNENAANERSKALAVQGSANAAAMARQQWATRNTPVLVGAGDTVVFAPGDPRGDKGPVFGLPTESTAKGALVERAGRGEQLPLTAQIVLGAMDKTPNPAAPVKSTPTELARLMAERDALPQDDPRREVYDRAILKETTRGNGISLAMPDGTTFQVGGDDVDPVVRRKAIEEDRKAELVWRSADDALAALSSRLAETGISVLPGKEQQETSTIYRLAINELRKLTESGALQKADLEYLESIIQDPTTLGAAIQAGGNIIGLNGPVDGILAQIKQARDYLRRARERTREVYRGGAAPVAPAAPAAWPAPAGPQPGTVVDGYRFKGGNPNDPTAWEPTG